MEDEESFETDDGDWGDQSCTGCTSECWMRGNTTGSAGTGPATNHGAEASNYFQFLESSSGYCYDSGDIDTIEYTATGTFSYVDFYYHMYGATMDILAIDSDSSYIYAATLSGLFRIAQGTSIEMPFGPQRYAVYYVYPTEEAVYAGGEFALYKYSRDDRTWTTALGFGVKDIVRLQDDIYALGTNNQIMRVLDEPVDSLAPDSGWVLLPYFNIYDIDTDGDVLYCATYSGIYYYVPEASLYRIIYNLPRMQYDYVSVINDQLVAVGKNSIYSLPLEHRD